MGTRNLTCVVSGGKYIIAQYGQWDGYPSGQGVTALEFLRKKGNQALLKAALNRCYYLTEEQMETASKQSGSENGWMTMEQAKKFHELLPYVNRDHGAKILEMVANSNAPVGLQNSIEFAKDSLFCEYAYIVDFDVNTFEIFKGFNKNPVSKRERFTGPADKEYFPIAKIKTYLLDKLPTKTQFLKDLKKEEE